MGEVAALTSALDDAVHGALTVISGDAGWSDGHDNLLEEYLPRDLNSYLPDDQDLERPDGKKSSGGGRRSVRFHAQSRVIEFDSPYSRPRARSATSPGTESDETS